MREKKWTLSLRYTDILRQRKRETKSQIKTQKSERLNGTERVTLTMTDYKLSERE